MDQISLYKLGVFERIESGSYNDISENKNNISFISNGYRFYIEKQNMPEVNNMSRVRPCSMNMYKIFDLDLDCNSNSIANCNIISNNLKRFLNEDLKITTDKEFDKLKMINNNYINITLNNSSTIGRFHKPSNGFMNNNSIEFIFKGLTHHLRYINNSINNNSKLNNISLYHVNDILTIENITIPPGSLFVYWYYVIPKSYGTLQTDTLMLSRINKSVTLHQKKLKIINMPSFKVNPRCSESRLYKNEILCLEYDVEYLGGGPEYVCPSISVDFDKESSYYYVYEENGTRRETINDNETFSRGKSKSIKRFIKFEHEGIQSIPGIWINEKHYAGNIEVTVDNKWNRYPIISSGLLTITITLILYFITIIVDRIYLSNSNNKYWRDYMDRNSTLLMLFFWFFLIITALIIVSVWHMIF